MPVTAVGQIGFYPGAVCPDSVHGIGIVAHAGVNLKIYVGIIRDDFCSYFIFEFFVVRGLPEGLGYFYSAVGLKVEEAEFV